MKLKESLKKRFYNLINEKIYWKSTDLLFEKFWVNYNSPERNYHNVDHIKDCLDEFDFVKNYLKKSNQVEMAIFGHDVIYDVDSQDNEERSAKFVHDLLRKIGMDAKYCNSVEDLILATKEHKTVGGDFDYLIDIDLSILGKPWTEFFKYEKNIRKEYSKYSDNLYNNKRKEVLNNFLKRDKIYLTDQFKDKYEFQARKNISKLLDVL